MSNQEIGGNNADLKNTQERRDPNCPAEYERCEWRSDGYYGLKNGRWYLIQPR